MRSSIRRKLSTMEPFLVHIYRQWPLVLIAMVSAFLVVAFNLCVPLLFKQLTDQIMSAEKGAARDIVQQRLTVVMAALMAVFILRRVTQTVSSYLASMVTVRMLTNVQRLLFEHLNKLPMTFFDEQRTGVLVSNLNNDTRAVQLLLHEVMVALFTSPITVVGAAVLVFCQDYVLGAVMLCSFPVLYVLVEKSGKRLKALGVMNQKVMSKVTLRFLETVRNIRIVRAFNRRPYEVEQFNAAAEEAYDLALLNMRTYAVVGFLTDFVLLSAFLLVIWLGVHRIATRQVSFGTLIALIAYLQTMRSSLTSLAAAYGAYQRASGAAWRLLEVLDLPVEEPPPPVPRSVDHTWRGGVSLRDVTFSYPGGHKVLDGACLELRPGEKIALTGESGIGKSTIASLLLGLYHPQGGAIEIDGIPFSEISPEELVDVVSIVPQEVGLFSGTVRENIAYAKLEATDEEVEAAARAANAEGFISRLPEGYETYVGGQGAKLSGGQRQRIAIARAVLRNPRVLILDEATSHVDPETEAIVLDALERLMADRTTIVIAHQSSALKSVHRMFEMKAGKLYEISRPAFEAKGQATATAAAHE